jgi:hypothetical protein
MVDASNGFAVGDNGVIRYWDGTNWVASTSPTTDNLNAVGCYGMSFCAAVGDGGVIVTWDGTAWSLASSPVVSRLNGVRFQSVTDGWAVGDFGTTLHWDGSTWNNETSLVTRDLYSVNYPGGGLAWVTGGVGSILSMSSSSGVNGTFLGAVVDTGSLNSIFEDVFFTYDSAPPAVITVAFRSGDIATPDGTWTAWSAEQTLPSADTSTSVAVDPSLSPHQYFQYRLTLSTGNPTIVPTVDTLTVTYQ